MHSQDMQVLAALQGWAAEGHRAALVTVARTWGSAPRPAGAWMALRDDGRVQGSVSGGCVEDDLIARNRAGYGQPRAAHRWADICTAERQKCRQPGICRFGHTAPDSNRCVRQAVAATGVLL